MFYRDPQNALEPLWEKPDEMEIRPATAAVSEGGAGAGEMA